MVNLRFEIKENMPVFTFWDIGVGDNTAIWFLQPDGPFLRMINYYQYQGKGMSHYISYIEQFRLQYKINYGRHFAPHDIRNREWSSGKSRLDEAEEQDLIFDITPSISRDDGINAARAIFGRVYFHEKNCQHGLLCLQNYHRTWDAARKTFSDKPYHDWSSDGADAFRYLAVVWREEYTDSGKDKTKQRDPYGMDDDDDNGWKTG